MGGSVSEQRVHGLWLSVLEEIVDVAAHEVRDVLNGVSLNLEVIRSRTGDGAGGAGEDRPVSPFATAASAQMEILSRRTEALLFMVRPARGPADVATTLKHLSELLIPAMKADGHALSMDGVAQPSPTSTSASATRFAVSAALVALTRLGGSCRCRLERPASGSGTVVRFSHESAAAVLDPEVAEAISGCSIDVARSGSDLLLVFPGS